MIRDWDAEVLNKVCLEANVASMLEAKNRHLEGASEDPPRSSKACGRDLEWGEIGEVIPEECWSEELFWKHMHIKKLKIEEP